MVAKMSDDDIWRLPAAATIRTRSTPPSRRAGTQGPADRAAGQDRQGLRHGQDRRGAQHRHQTKKLTTRTSGLPRPLQHPDPGRKLAEIPFYKPADDTPEMKYLHERRKALGGYLPQRRAKADEQFTVPSLETFKSVLEPTAEGREISTTQAYVRFLTQLLRDKAWARASCRSWSTRRAPSAWKACSARSASTTRRARSTAGRQRPGHVLQGRQGRPDPAGRHQRSGRHELDRRGDLVLTNNRIMIPFYVYYSMFGFQRVGDLAWAAGDMQARGFLLGGTSGRTTLNGEGLQHEDGHSHILAGTIPNCVSYDPTFAHEVAVIMQDGLRRMVENQEDVFYYITIMNENYEHAGPEGRHRRGHPQGHVPAAGRRCAAKLRVQLIGCGTILRDRTAEERLGRRRRRLVGAVADAAGPRRPGLPSAGTWSTRPTSSACRT
jgi:pyruvate dehydrogenase E1 component